MAIENFDDKHCPELSEEDADLVEMFRVCFEPRVGKDKSITNVKIQETLRGKEIELSSPKIRAIIHEVRIRHLPDLIAGSGGYWRGENMEEVKEYYRGLNRRIRSQQHILAAGTNFIMSNQNPQ